MNAPEDDAVLPPGLSAGEWGAALRTFASALGDDAVLRAGQSAEFRDPYSFPGWDDHWPSAVVQPGSVADVQAVTRIARQYRIPLWTTSMGKNNAYGGPAPRVRGSVVVSLRRLNRVLEVSEDLAYAVVEPGVSFFDLCAELKRRGSALWASIPDLGWGSVIGNTVDHGVGYLPGGNHADSMCGLEVVLASGEVIRTGMGAMAGNQAWHAHRRGFGPSVDGLFMQSNFGIVTKMGKWLTGTCGLMPAGDGLLQWWFDLRWTPATPPPDKPLTMIRERFGDWAPPVRAVLAAVTDDETGFFPHYRHRVPRTWGSGRITVIGDAAHSMPPTRAQGANQALEDAWALAAALRNAANQNAPGSNGANSNAADSNAGTEPALRAFERARSRKASVVSRQAGSEDYNLYGAVLSRLIPGSLASRYYTRWLAQVSTYLDPA